VAKLSLEHINELLDGSIETIVCTVNMYNKQKMDLYDDLVKAGYITSLVEDNCFIYNTTPEGKKAIMKHYSTRTLIEAVMKHNLAIVTSAKYNHLANTRDIIKSNIGKSMSKWFLNIY